MGNVNKIIQMPKKENPMTSCMTPAAFNALPRNKKAILVAKDVLLQIKKENIRPSTGAFISPRILNNVYINSMDYISAGNSVYDPSCDSTSVSSKKGKEIIKNSECHVCAKGAIFLSAIQKSNKMSLGELKDMVYKDDTGEEIIDKVVNKNKIFTKDNFDLIEAAFECEPRYYRDTCMTHSVRLDGHANEWVLDKKRLTISEKKALAAANFGWKYEDSDERLVAICKNIIKNNGVFDPFKP